MPTEITCEQCSEQFEVGDSGLAVCPACGHAANLPGEPVSPTADETLNLDSDRAPEWQAEAEEATLIGGFEEHDFDPESALTEALDADDLPNFAGIDDSPTVQAADVPDFLSEQGRNVSGDDSDTRFEQRDAAVEAEAGAEDRDEDSDSEPTVMMEQGQAAFTAAASAIRNDEPATGARPLPAATAGAASSPGEPTFPATPAAPAAAVGSTASVNTRPTATEAARGVSSGLFVAVASYASAVTLALLYLLFFAGGEPHQLESLPDLEPLSDEEFQIIPAEAALAPGHRLQLGRDEGTRFGNIRVRPLRVTRGPVEYDYFMQSSTAPTRKPTAPVLKLWLEFTNDSKDQVFTPLDGRLLARDHVRESDFQRFANNFLRPAGQEISPEQLVFTLGHSPTDPFNIRDQNLGKRLQPGESCVMFVPSDEEGLAALEGDLVWRLQLRKGFHPETRHGVTTLIEVEFSTADVEAETAEESSETAETETT